jgi:hypothetical protein
LDTLSTSLLGIIAFSALVQAAFLIGLGIAAARLFRRVDVLTERLERGLEPSLDQAARVARNVAEVSDRAVEHSRRLDAVVAEASEKVAAACGFARSAAPRGPAPLVELSALWRGTRRAVEVLGSGNGGPARGEPRTSHGRRPTPSRDDLGRPHDVWEERQAEAPVR